MARPKKLRAKKQAAQAAAAAAAERERRTLYNEWEDRWLSSQGWEDYGSEGFNRPPPELFGFSTKSPRRTVFWGMLSMPAAVRRREQRQQRRRVDEEEAEAEAAVAGA